MPGVVETSVGYSGGSLEHPTYEQVCGGQTGHTEVVEVVYDPQRLPLENLLEHFWRAHDPTRLAKAQYRSVVFYTTPEQRPIIEASKEREARRLGRPIATLIAPAGAYWRAEAYHQRYVAKRKERIGC